MLDIFAMLGTLLPKWHGPEENFDIMETAPTLVAFLISLRAGKIIKP